VASHIKKKHITELEKGKFEKTTAKQREKTKKEIIPVCLLFCAMRSLVLLPSHVILTGCFFCHFLIVLQPRIKVKPGMFTVSQWVFWCRISFSVH